MIQCCSKVLHLITNRSQDTTGGESMPVHTVLCVGLQLTVVLLVSATAAIVPVYEYKHVLSNIVPKQQCNEEGS